MLKALALSILTLAIILHTGTAFCDTETKTYKVSVTIPESVNSANAAANSFTAGPQSNGSFLVQVQSAVRNNHAVLLKSIVLL